MNMVSVVGNVASELRLLAYGFGPSEFEYANKNLTSHNRRICSRGATRTYHSSDSSFFLTIAAELFTGLYRGRKHIELMTLYRQLSWRSDARCRIMDKVAESLCLLLHY